MSANPAARLGDMGSGHACHFPPTEAIEGSPNVFINGRPAVRLGDACASHTCPEHGGEHPRKLAEGSSSVFINGRPAVRLGDAIDCGGAMITGSGNVFIGDGRGTPAPCPGQMAKASSPFFKE